LQTKLNRRQGRREVAQFLVYLVGRCDRIRDDLPQNLTVALSQTADMGFEGVFAHAQLRGSLAVPRVFQIAREKRLQFVEKLSSASVLEFFAEQSGSLLQRCESPAPVKQFVRRYFVHWFEVITLFGGLIVEGQNLAAPATLQGSFAVPFISGKMFESGQEKRPKPAALTLGLSEVLLLKQTSEKTLGQVLAFSSPWPDRRAKA